MSTAIVPAGVPNANVMIPSGSMETDDALYEFVYPKLGLVDIYETRSIYRVLRVGDVLRGDSVLPGFELPLAESFRPIAPHKA